MPELGEIKRGKEIGYASRDRGKYIWHACMDCGKRRWVRFIRGESFTILCMSCCRKGINHADKQWHWKGGKTHESGYVLIHLLPDDFFYPMARKTGYVAEHRLVMAKHIGRNLHRWEIIHHKNGKRDDNCIKNLQLVTDDRHTQITIMENKIKQLESRVTQLEAENILLKSQTVML